MTSPSPTAPMPISLSDDELSFVMRITEPLPPSDRSAYLHALAKLLRQEPVIGPGVLCRLAKDLLREFWRPPAVTNGPHPPRHTTKLRSLPAILASAAVIAPG